MTLPPFPSELSAALTVRAFGRALAEFACKTVRAHGVQVWAVVGGSLVAVGEEGRGLGLSDGTVAARALAQGQPVAEGMLACLPFGGGVLEFVGADPEGVEALSGLTPLLTLALEGVQAREVRRGRGRVAETVEQLVRRLGGSLNLPEVLTATAESAALALGFGRAFVGLFSEVGEAGARTGEVFTHGFDEAFTGGIAVGPVSFGQLVERGEVILYERTRDAGTPLAAGLAELDPEVALIAPLSARGRPLGVLYVDSRSPGARASEDDTWLVLALAEQASLAIDNARLYSTETRKREAAEALREAGAALAGSLHLRDTLSRLLERATALFGTDAAGVYELQPDGRTLTIRNAVGLPNDYVLRVRAKVGAGVTGRAVERREIVVAHDLTREHLGGGSRYTRQLLAQGRYPYRGVVGLPLGTRAGVFGALTLYWKDPLPLGEDDLALTEVFAAQASLAIENARLYEEELRREREAAVLLNVGRLLGEDQSDPALAEAARLATLALNAGRGLIALMGEDGQMTRCATFNLHAPGPSELASLLAQLGRGPRPLTRRHALPVAGSALIVPLRGDPGGDGPDHLLGFLYADDPGTEAPSDRVLGLARSVADQMALTLTRERLLSALARQEARYRQLAEGAHDLILSADPAGTITYANPAATRLLEPLTGPLIGANLLTLPTPATRGALHAAWDAVNTHAAGGRTEIEIGPYRLEVRLSAMRQAGVPQSVLAVARDLSELQTLAAEIQRRGQALEAATSRQSELRSYLTLFTQAQEEERRRISRELHDDTAQVLIATSRRVARLARDLDGPQRARADDILGDLNAAIESVRRFARNLRPSVLDDLGLLPALEWLAGQAQTETRLEVSGSERRLAPALELTVFRLAQEALTNVDKHARARSAAIRVAFEEGGVRVAITDDGQGFTTDQAQARAQAGHLGLIGLRERVTLAGGELGVESEPGRGTRLTFTLPG
ncbi:GAF domain-containing protein [Deinococcus metallilatus]|uniref:Oxygen sensor histidine kinase NreB n=1 Tax=Deinococcus metallilatus TaxID=1211322 RepID=A0AAJ5F5Y2_9DEIO|nr:GAF domain-containing protein [Deinococcus metallilatus]MBB5295863.1 PAS domain S-box-containing protein [Deinococcus metallilatus]QBY08296.1 GAF domain-containing protein [Deinococcus metallilatus]RXJ12027.1 GAF domain-containing protein [Deinococcus metallilatus]TLK25741.1 GAF domain-containing protein [Deinococcus metallilatus]